MIPARDAEPGSAPAETERVLVVIPVHDEEDSLAGVLAEVRAAVPSADVVVVDDGSRDGSRAVAEKAGALVIQHPFNLGYGAAIQTGFQWAARRGYPRVALLDADGQHDPRELPSLLAALDREGADVVLGSRFLGRADYHIPWLRRLGMRIFSRAASVATGRRITDASSGYQALRGGVVRFLAAEPFPTDFPDADNLIMLHRAGFRVAEVPAVMRPRRAGRSMIANTRSLYYVFKMALSILVTLLRAAPRPAREDRS